MGKYTLIIADDEEISRKALNLLIQKEFPEIEVIAQAQNGTELVNLVQKHQPDIAIVDVNMPGINGIDAIDMLSMRGSKTRFIINTAYEEFDYVQRALEMKVDAYLLKPERRENTVTTIRNICVDIERNRAAMRSNQQIWELFSNIQPVLESEILYSLFIGEPSTESFHAYCEMHGYQFAAGVMVVLLPVIGNRLDPYDKSQIHGFLQDTFGISCNYLAASTESSISLLIFVPAGNASEQRRWLEDVVNVALEKLKTSMSIPLYAGVGMVYTNFEKMSDSYREGLLALADRKGQSDVVFYQSDQGTDGSSQIKVAARTLALAVREGNLQRISTETTCQRKLVHGDRNAALELWRLIGHELKSSPDLPHELSTQINYVSTCLMETNSYPNFMEVIRDGLSQIATIYKCGLSEKSKDYVEKAMRYIECHFVEDLSLEDVAKLIGVSSSYLSRQFSTKLGKSFVEYLTDVRMRAALTLAMETRLTIREIAERSGYSNTAYFCRVFKRCTGKTVGELRAETCSKSE